MTDHLYRFRIKICYKFDKYYAHTLLRYIADSQQL